MLQPTSEHEDTSNTSSGVLSSPNYPENYPIYKDCVWKLIAPKDHFISLTFLSDIDLEKADNCKFDYLDIFLLDAQGELLVDNSHLCGSQSSSQLNSGLTGTAAELQTQIVVIHFHSDGSYTGRGFQLSYTLQGNCEVVIGVHGSVHPLELFLSTP